jgi:2-phospho-L-lactate guanylyltransferase
MFTALIPVKEFQFAKRRLSEVLRPKERREFAAAMLTDTLEMVAKAASISRIAVVTADPDARKLALEHRADVFEETGANGLNGALNQAAATLSADGACAVMVLPTDIILADTDDLDALTKIHLSLGTDLTIVAAGFDFGTNCLLATRPAAMTFCFGELSSIHHFEAAKARGYNAKILRVSKLDRDIDNISDLRFFCKAAPSRHSWRCLVRNQALERILALDAADHEDYR